MDLDLDLVKKINKSERKAIESREREKYLSHIGIMLTEKCNIKCNHCIIDCNSSSSNEITLLTLDQLIIGAKNSGTIKTIGITGGEPFLEWDKLLYSIKKCSKFGIKTSVVTNGYWAETLEKTRRKLEEIKAIIKIAVSTDSFHQEFIPIQNVKNIIQIANELGIECQIRVSHLNDPVREINQIREQLTNLEGRFELISQPVQPFGRASKFIEPQLLYTYDAAKIACRTADRMLILVTGDVLACCGPQDINSKNHPMYLGNIHNTPLDEIMAKADLNQIIHILRLWGPGELVRLILEQANEEQVKMDAPTTLEKQDICSLCRYALDDELKVKLLRNVILTQNLSQDIATARLLNLYETSMILNEE